LLLSWAASKNSLAGARTQNEAIKKAAEQGDYQTAQALYEEMNSGSTEPVLGVMSEIETLVYPERKVEQRISELLLKLEEYPGNREIYLSLAELYSQIGNEESAQEYREKARILDPNN
jgi:tetratricopeptide (TPR) repeat protein